MKNAGSSLLILVLLCRVDCVAQSLSRESRPEVLVGESWVYRDRDVNSGETRETSFSVKAVAADKIITETGLSTSGLWTFTRDWNLIERRTGTKVEEVVMPYWPHFEFPLEAGKTWIKRFENEVMTKRGKRDAKWEWKAHVAGAELVTVPAGRFQTLRVDYNGSFSSREDQRSWTGTRKETIWYAPEAKRGVKREFEQSVPQNHYYDHHVIELVSFKLP